ncbi:hypothetical protein LA52FAK_13490 [Desulforhopalus sp. 52FAK]
MTSKTTIRLIAKIATILMAISAAALFWVRDLRFLLVLIPSTGIYYWYKKNYTDQKEELEDFATKSSLLFLVIPIGILLSGCIFVIGWIIYSNIFR